jgi:hypothetical protein
MAKHIFKGTTAPSFAPRQVGHHYVNITNGDMYISKGFITPADWVLLGTSVDERVKISSNDTTPGYLNGKLVSGTGITLTELNNGGNETLRIEASGAAFTDEKVKVSAADTTPGYLNDEFTVSNGTNTTSPLEKSITNPAADEKLNIKFDETKVNHNNLLNFVANKHIDHSTVSINTTEGIQGGGDITASRTLKMDINGLAVDATPDAAVDYIASYDASTGIHKKILLDTIIQAAGASSAIGPRFSDFDQEDFHQHHIFHFLNVIANGGIVTLDNAAPVDNSYMGRVILDTGITSNSTGRATLDGNSSVSNIKLANMSVEWRVRIPTLSNGTTGFQFRAGFMDANTAGDSANGVFFYYSDTENSGRWRVITRNASTSTTVDSTIAVVANTWYKLRWVSSGNGATVMFYIDDVLIGTSSSNTPVTNATRLMAKIEKKAPNSAVSRTVDIDYLGMGVQR